MATRADYDRMAGCRKKFQATIKRHRWGLLFDEFKAAGWRAVRVNQRTGCRAEKHEPGIWVMRYVGFESDTAPALARRCATVTLKSRELAAGEVGR